MSETGSLSLPLLLPSQAQKHVTVNEALVRVDALASSRVETRDQTVPPTSPADGETHIVGAGAGELIFVQACHFKGMLCHAGSALDQVVRSALHQRDLIAYRDIREERQRSILGH